MNVLKPFAQVGDQFQHRLIDHLRIEPLGDRMLGGGDPLNDDPVKLIGGHACMRLYHYRYDGFFTTREHAFNIAAQQRGKRLLGLPFGMLRGQHLHPIESE